MNGLFSLNLLIVWYRKLSYFTRVFCKPYYNLWWLVEKGNVPDRNIVLCRVDKLRSREAVDILWIFDQLKRVEISICCRCQNASMWKPFNFGERFVEIVVCDVRKSIIWVGWVSQYIPNVDCAVLAGWEYTHWGIFCRCFYWNYAIWVLVSLLVPLIVGVLVR